jgi:hypothetical protein
VILLVVEVSIEGTGAQHSEEDILSQRVEFICLVWPLKQILVLGHTLHEIDEDVVISWQSLQLIGLVQDRAHEPLSLVYSCNIGPGWVLVHILGVVRSRFLLFIVLLLVLVFKGGKISAYVILVEKSEKGEEKKRKM